MRLLLILTAACALWFVFHFGQMFLDSQASRDAPGMLLGSDFANLWSAARLVLEGNLKPIYEPDAFMAYQRSFAGDLAGFRLWAYPPHVLLLIWPFGLGNYHLMLLVWAALGLSVLAFGARRFGFSWTETLLLVLSPAALQNIMAGQSGSIVCGLLLLAFAGRSGHAPRSILATALLTVKPQVGFLVPLLWLMRGRWVLIIGTTVAAALLVGGSLIVFGVSTWRDYLQITLPALSNFEQAGEGEFLRMIPSLFISLRLLGIDGVLASKIHLAFAAVCFVLLVWCLRRVVDERWQIALIMIATCLITPYLHAYDLSILLAGALMVYKASTEDKADTSMAAICVTIAWSLPIFIDPLAALNLPISPLLILGMFWTAFFLSPRLRFDSQGTR